MNNQTNWYTVKVQHNYEQKVSDRIELEMKRSNREIKVHIPKERTFLAKNGKKVPREKALYPGYIFVETESIGELVRIVRETSGASNILKGKDGAFATLRVDEANKMLNQKQEFEQPFNNELYIIGEDVEIIDGPFTDIVGKIDTINLETKRVVVLVSIFKKITPVDLAIDQITKKGTKVKN
jgi:transcriptional antiterminator NusG